MDVTFVRLLRQAVNPAPALSVIVPMYDAARYVNQALQSVFSQAGLPLEVIVIDDGSTDQSLAQVLTLTDSRLTVLAAERNVGVCLARNTGSLYARAPWLCWLDADDVVQPDFLDPYFQFVSRQSDARWGYCQLTVVDEQLRPTGLEMGECFDLLHLLQWTIALNGLLLVRRDFFYQLNGYDRRYRIGEDYDLWLRMVEWSDPLFFARAGLWYRRHPLSACQKIPGFDNKADIQQLMRARIAKPTDHPEQARRRERLRRALCLLEAAQAGDWSIVLSQAFWLREQQVGGFQLICHQILACKRLGRFDEAMRLGADWIDQQRCRASFHIKYMAWLLNELLEMPPLNGLQNPWATFLQLARQIEPFAQNQQLTGRLRQLRSGWRHPRSSASCYSEPPDPVLPAIPTTYMPSLGPAPAAPRSVRRF